MRYKNIYWKAADGTGTAERLTASDTQQWVNAVSPDGTRVVARTIVPDRQNDLIAVTLDGDQRTEMLLSTEFNEVNAAISPDGDWVAFESNASGQDEVYVHPFPEMETGQWQVSTAGGQDPLWSPDGRELFFWQGNQLMAASIETEPAFSRATPQMLFEGTYFTATGRTYDVAPDGRFLMIKTGGQTDEAAPLRRITVVLNWFEELKARVPVN